MSFENFDGPSRGATEAQTAGVLEIPVVERAATSASVVWVMAERIARILLRLSLAIVYIWFGVLKLAGASPVTQLVGATLPFADPKSAVRVLGVLEIIIGIGLLSRRSHRAFLIAVVIHLAGTFLTVVMAPALLWSHGNPTLLTTDGEFVLKNLVLLNAAVLLAVLPRTPHRLSSPIGLPEDQ